MKLIPATGEDLVSVCLMANVPDKLVVWCIKNVVQGDGQLNNPETRAKMATVDRYIVDNEVSKFVA